MIKRAKPTCMEIIAESREIAKHGRLSHWGKKYAAIKNINERLEYKVSEMVKNRRTI